MAVYIDAEFDTDQLERFAAQLAREIDRGGGGPMQGALKAAGAVYMGFTRERFERYSRGGGDWPPLAESTLRRRRKGRNTQGAKRADLATAILQARGVQNAGRPAILRDTGLLFNSLTTYQTEPIDAGVRVGTYVDYAVHHQEGGKNLPKREIFVQPDATTTRRIGEVLERGYQRSVDLLGGGT